MSMDELLLQELYGSQQAQADEQVKQAQIELVEAVAAEAGVDLNELDDDELAKFAHYILTDEDEHLYADGADAQLAEKLAEADLVGRQMAASYHDEITSLENGAAMFDKVAHAMSTVAEAWELEKIALSAEEVRKMVSNPDYNPANDQGRTQMREYMRRLETQGKKDRIRGTNVVGDYYRQLDREKPWSTGKKVGLGLGAAALAGGLGYGAYRMYKNRQEKKAELMSAFDADDFASLAEQRAAEILLSNGIDPVTLTDCEPEFAKIASFYTPDMASNDVEFEAIMDLNEMLDAAAEHIIDSLIN